ncbi:jg21191 [Pararge aegeria aegeria]|uniref:Jg21191 protein n=1 Tax=Pararge aegeria aegeria TaxID=348720 RepID=A0A8S4RCI0_9NEOP|nr:jg21191 [Pararge aegeria aegeria]
MERSEIKRIQKIRHDVIRQKTMVIDALHYSQRLKWRWAGHKARMVDDRWTIRLTSWPGPAGHRKVGRPYARWSDDIAKVAGINWMQVAKDRDRWSSLEEAFTLA